MTQKIKEIKWQDPLQMAQIVAQNYDQDWVFLYSGLSDEVRKSKSVIALFAKNKLKLEDLSELKKYLTKDDLGYENAYFGWVSYEYKNALENFTKSEKSALDLEKIYLANFALIFEFDHDKNILKVFFDEEEKLDEVLKYKESEHNFEEIKTKSLFSNFSSQEYISAICDVQKMIQNGDFYQTNLTRKFFGEFNFSKQIDFFEIFKGLCKSSAANFSSFVKFDDNFVISASPELFLQVKDGKVISRPIKGTSPRSEDVKIDEENKKYLTESEKEKAENLMIVDLVRNDLSRICAESSVHVDDLFRVNSYKTLHHLSSEISGKIKEKFDCVDVFKACFPAGSMTGAPKIKAVEAANCLEKINRGIYSGAIGVFKNCDEAIFSVVIRTLICQKNKFEFQVGGAITFDSDPQKELEETFVKAKAICKILNIDLT